jgi:hypothetical protein
MFLAPAKLSFKIGIQITDHLPSDSRMPLSYNHIRPQRPRQPRSGYESNPVQSLKAVQERRAFLRSLAMVGISGALNMPVSTSSPLEAAKSEDRSYWLAVMERIATPVLKNLARRKLKKTMPVEASNPADRVRYTHLEAFGRTLAGIAPWLAAQGLDRFETERQEDFLRLAQVSLDAATDPSSPDFMNFHEGNQPLVDTAFLAQGIIRAPSVLWESLDVRIRMQLINAMKSSRSIPTPTSNNWVMFAAIIEAVLHIMGEKTIEERLEGCVRRMLGWYKGDGVFGDGQFLHFDYYNSFVIHPMLLDVLAVLERRDKQFESVYRTELERARRYAEIQERLIAPDGSFPSLGRSTTYRFGALQALAQMALMRELPEQLKPSQVRSAITAVIHKMVEAPHTFDESGWLRIGFCGHQPSLAEDYISTGSLYLCTAALLPLGLPPDDPFWSTPPTRWSSQRIWSGESSLSPDHALTEG